MYKWIDFTNLGGNPLDQESFGFMQSSYRDAFKAIAKMVGDKVIMSGMVITGSSISAGWFTYGGDMIPFLGGSLSTDVFINQTRTPITFDDQVVHDVEITDFAVCGTPGTFPFSDLVRLEDLKTLQQSLTALITAFNAHTHAWADITGKPAGYVSYVGSVSVGDVGAVTPNVSLITVTIPDQGTTDYVVSGSLVSQAASHATDNNVIWVVREQAATNFKLSLREISGGFQVLLFRFTITKSL